MNDFTKHKIAFAVALLAVLFAVTPLLNAIGSVGFNLFGVAVTFRLLYYVLSALLALSVYCYGVQFAFERPRRFLTATGDVLYAAAVVAPVAFALLFAGAELATLLGNLLRSQVATAIVSGITGAVSGVISTYLAVRTQRGLAAKERDVEVKAFEQESVVQLRRAEELFKAGHHDLAVVEAFRAVELSVRRSAALRGLPFIPQWTVKGIGRELPEELRQDLEYLRQLRNTAAHAAAPVTAEQARKGLAIAGRLLSALSGYAA